METEIWKDIKGYEGKYQVSSLGRIKSSRGILKGYKNKSGYIRIDIGNPIFIHRIVGNNFIENIQNKPFINHKNGIKDDNRVENLEWCTASENQKHAYGIGLKKMSKSHIFKTGKLMRGLYGENHPASKKVIQKDKDGKIVGEYNSLLEAEISTGIKKSSISSVCNKRTGYKSAGGYTWEFKY